ncbi:MAG: hypothetical protein R3360_06875, partial [Alphaproteobacteria bacterium]|nr:hypothetical protein [Alphaproteobacteria bacterium]
MSTTTEQEITEPRLRITLAGLGLLQGIGMFVLFDVVDDVVDIDLLLALGVFLVITPVWLALSIGLGDRRAAIGLSITYGVALALLWLW